MHARLKYFRPLCCIFYLYHIFCLDVAFSTLTTFSTSIKCYSTFFALNVTHRCSIFYLDDLDVAFFTLMLHFRPLCCIFYLDDIFCFDKSLFYLDDIFDFNVAFSTLMIFSTVNLNCVTILKCS